jgi:hypothetical protein
MAAHSRVEEVRDTIGTPDLVSSAARPPATNQKADSLAGIVAPLRSSDGSSTQRFGHSNRSQRAMS